MRTFGKISFIGICCFLLYALIVEPFLIRVNEIKIKDENFSEFFKAYKTVLISDIHVSNLGNREKLLLKKINKISPDIIFLAGDYVSWNGDYDKAFNFLSRLKANLRVFGVLGDSDYQSSRNSCKFCHSFSKKNDINLQVRFLRNETAFLAYNNSQMAISGVEVFQKDLSEANRIIKHNPDCPEILISHKQITLGEISNRSILVLSGDTHGGQIYMPEKVWQKVFGRSKGNVRAGLIEKDKKKLFVTTGIGTNSIPFRFMCSPEIVLFKGDE